MTLRSRRAPTSIAAPMLLAALMTASLFVGVGDLAPGGSAEAISLILDSRLPRTLAAVLAGAALAIAGLVLQTLARNRFVEPTTAGSGQSAALGILIVTLLAPDASIAVKTLAASLAALVGTSVFLMVAHRLPPEQPLLVPLFALVYGGVVGAALTFLAWQADLLQYVEVWTTGEFSGVLRGRYELLWVTLVMIALAWWVADQLTVLSLGRDVAIGLGLDYRRMMQIGLVIVSVISALTVVVVGIIPFIGLVVPNLVSRVMGDDVRGAIPWVAASGGGLVLLCDILGRLVRHPYEIPIGTILGVVGAALFLILLFRRRADA
ncbi:ABC transporter permease [Terrihabitans sp. B22-R8]|uniref:ABC transporter permease n=1 Tax=Terrihabitans sp. B22-R8 TaxID=3425128 RepID=UPI00403C4503